MAGEIVQPSHLLKSPMVLEFLGLPDSPDLHESKLEQAIIDNLQNFLLELGKGFCFVARQKHIRFGDDDFYIDLVFYNYVLKCFLLNESRQVFASKYLPNLPTEEELRLEIEKERRLIEINLEEQADD